MKYWPELQFSPFPMDQWPNREESVKIMVVLDLKWAEEVSSDGIKLWITPTAKTNLSCAPQALQCWNIDYYYIYMWPDLGKPLYEGSAHNSRNVRF